MRNQKFKGMCIIMCKTLFYGKMVVIHTVFTKKCGPCGL